MVSKWSVPAIAAYKKKEVNPLFWKLALFKVSILFIHSIQYSIQMVGALIYAFI